MKSQNISSSKKKIALDKFDEENFSENRTEVSEILNQVGKINVGWNLSYLKTLPSIDTIIDVGSADDFSVLHNAFPEAYSILIDPNVMFEDTYKKYLKTRRGEYHLCALSDKSYLDKFFFYPDKPYLSTLIKRSDVGNLKYEEKEINVKKLDNLIDYDNIKKNVLLKIDAEGNEIKILKGSSKLLDICKIVICECSLDDNFPGGYTFSEIYNILNNKEFKLKDVIRVPRKEFNAFPAEVLDVVFVKNL